MKGHTKSIAALLLLVLLTAAGCSAAPQDSTYQQISMEEAAEMMETQEDFILLDVRTEEEFAEKHIPGAICIPNEKIGTEEIPQLPDAEMMETQEDFILLDVRTEEEFAEKHIPGAICIPNEKIGTEEIPQLPDREQLILVYCRSGNRSKQASQKLAELGYSNVVECGGIQDWTGETVSGAA